ncbi:MAG: DNA polymerase III subunit gamma/tau [Hyphomicrobiaceae bacterium]|nr:MAG: DNA polymerase III subunit gamma/tau [Hyphomicrobiaceae bacterium]
MAKRSTGTSAPGAGSGKRASKADATPEAKPYVVLARKYRPQNFDELIGQDAMVRTLKNAFASDRIAQAYMLTGVRGVGKTTTARILARALNYDKADAAARPTIDMPEPGEHCQAIMEGRHPDVVEMDAASNTGVDNVREIVEGARYRPVSARFRVYIIDEVHMLSKGAFNALLKTLEEPPPHVKFIFATTEIRKVPVTVLSRCQRFDLRRVEVPALAQHFRKVAEAEGATIEDDALLIIARAAEGSVRDGLSILDQAIAMRGGTVSSQAVRAMLGLADRGRVLELLEIVFRGDAKGALQALAALHKDGADPIEVLGDLAEGVHLASRAKALGGDPGSEGLSEEERRRASALADRLAMALLVRAWQMLLKGREEASRAPDPQTAAEMILLRLAFTADLPTPDEVVRGLAGRAGAAAPSRPSSSPPAPPSGSRAVAAAGAIPAQAPPMAPAVAAPDTGGEGPELNSFEDVIAFVAAKREARLRVLLEEDVSLVRYEPGKIDLHLLARAPKELANELREKLNAWTGRKWMVAVSAKPGARPIGEARREAKARLVEEARAEPFMKKLLGEFPEAEIVEVRDVALPEDAFAIENPDSEPDEESAAG